MEQGAVVSHIENRSLTAEEVALLASLITDEPDHYTVLGINRTASSEEIQTAYCLAVEYFHPLKSKITQTDRVMHWKLSSAFLRIEEAFKVLSRRSRREIYDDNLSDRPGRPKPRARRLESPDPRQPLQIQQSGADPMRHALSGDPPEELRRVDRVPLVIPLRVNFDRHWQELTETMDVSPLGVRFHLSRPLEPGSELRLEMPMPKHLRTHSYDDDLYVVSAFVIYASTYESGRQIVAEFI